jgi:ankyrin repeat protein
MHGVVAGLLSCTFVVSSIVSLCAMEMGPVAFSDKQIADWSSTKKHLAVSDFYATAKDSDGNTVLHHLCQYSAQDSARMTRQERYEMKKVADLLLDTHADLGAQNSKGNTPLHLAATREAGHELVTALIDRFDDATINKKNKKGRTALDKIIKKSINGRGCRSQHCYNDFVELLVDHGASVISPGTLEFLNIHNNAYHGLFALVRLSLAYDPDLLNMRDNEQRTPINATVSGLSCPLLAAHHHEKIVSFLLEKKAEIGIPDMRGNLPIHWAVSAQSVSTTGIVQLLLQHDSSGVNASNEKGDTPLHVSARNTFCSVNAEQGSANMHLLIQNKARLAIKNKEGQTPEDIARSQSNPAVINLLTPRASCGTRCCCCCLNCCSVLKNLRAICAESPKLTLTERLYVSFIITAFLLPLLKLITVMHEAREL